MKRIEYTYMVLGGIRQTGCVTVPDSYDESKISETIIEKIADEIKVEWSEKASEMEPASYIN